MFPSQTLVSSPIFHLNTESARNKCEEITGLLDSFAFEFVLVVLTEAWHSENDMVPQLDNHGKFNLYKRGKRGGGLSVYVKSCVICFVISVFTIITESSKS